MSDHNQSSEDGNTTLRDAPAPAKLFIVTGGRDYPDRSAVFAALDALHRKHANLTIIHGACCERDDPTVLTGADRWAHEWSLTRQCPVISVPAPWRAMGDSAGPRRNTMMLWYLPDGCVAFPGGIGTADMARKAEAAGLTVWKP